MQGPKDPNLEIRIPEKGYGRYLLGTKQALLGLNIVSA